MSVGSAPIFRFTVLNPALLPLAAGGGARSRIEFIWEPAYDYNNAVPTNTWRNEEVTFSKVCVCQGASCAATMRMQTAKPGQVTVMIKSPTGDGDSIAPSAPLLLALHCVFA